MQTANGFSVLYHVFARKPHSLSCVTKSYLTLPYVTSLRDSFCLGNFAHVFARKQCILCSTLRHKSYLLHYLMLHRFEIHSALQLWRTAILCCRRFAASRLREAARWQLMHSYRNLNEYYEVLKLTRSCATFSMEKREKKRNEPWKRWIDRDTQCANSYRATIRVIFDCHAICNSSKFRSVQPVHTDGPH